LVATIGTRSGGATEVGDRACTATR
jgi:hypothetical protein